MQKNKLFSEMIDVRMSIMLNQQNKSWVALKN
jgi:hypothetical protein